MLYIEAPKNKSTDKLKLFLAGSITDAPDWQKEVVERLEAFDIAVLNPRRKNFPMEDPDAAREQITWEHDSLKDADMISFWFAKESLAPITLYELGAWTKTGKPIVIGVDPKYRRKQDVEIQTSLERPEIPICYSLDDLVENIRAMILRVVLSKKGAL